MTKQSSLGELTLGIIGLGMMGGSIGLASAGIVARRLGSDSDAAATSQAVEIQAIDEAISLEEMAQRSDVIVIATPVNSVPPILATLGQLHTTAVVLDIGSVKETIVAAMDALPASISAIGTHPMCGREHAGIHAASGDLFRGAQWAVCETSRSDSRAQQVVELLIRALGGIPVAIAADSHDRVVAQTSHLPFMAGSALARVAHDAAMSTRLFGGGLLDAIRLASGDSVMWRAVLAANRTNIVAALDAYSEELSRAREYIVGGSEEDLAEWMSTTAEAAREVRSGVV